MVEKAEQLRAGGLYLLLYFFHDRIINITFINTCRSMLPQTIMKKKKKKFVFLNCLYYFNFKIHV